MNRCPPWSMPALVSAREGCHLLLVLLNDNRDELLDLRPASLGSLAAHHCRLQPLQVRPKLPALLLPWSIEVPCLRPRGVRLTLMLLALSRRGSGLRPVLL